MQPMPLPSQCRRKFLFNCGNALKKDSQLKTQGMIIKPEQKTVIMSVIPNPILVEENRFGGSLREFKDIIQMPLLHTGFGVFFGCFMWWLGLHPLLSFAASLSLPVFG